MISYADRVWETSTTTGTSTLNLDGALQSYQTFVDGAGGGSDVPYAIFDDTNWEVGKGTVTAGSPDTLSRDTVIASSNSDNAVNWGAGTRNVILPASTYFAVWRDENLNYTGDFGTSGGTGDVQTLTFSPQRLGLSDGMIVTWASAGTNTTDVTINIDGLGAKSYVNADGTEFAAGAVADGDIQQAVYILSEDKFFKTTPNLANALRSNVTATLTAGYTATAYNAGTKTTGTYTPAASDGNFQRAVNGGAHTLAPPTGDCTMVIQYTNNSSAGAITTSGFTLVDGDGLTTTDGDDFLLYITVVNSLSSLTVKALQ